MLCLLAGFDVTGLRRFAKVIRGLYDFVARFAAKPLMARSRLKGKSNNPLMTLAKQSNLRLKVFASVIQSDETILKIASFNKLIVARHCDNMTISEIGQR